MPHNDRGWAILYNLYLADFNPNIDNNRKVIQYADDTLLVQSSISHEFALQKVTGYFNQTEEYLGNWGIEVNIDKTNIMIACPDKKNGNNQSLKLIAKLGKDQQQVKMSKTLKYLGVIFDRKGRFNDHTKYAALKGRQATGALRWLLTNKDLKHKVKILIYKSLIRSKVTYASTI